MPLETQPRAWVEVALVVGANPHTQIYFVRPLWRNVGDAPVEAVALGSLGNSSFGVDTQQTYMPGTPVLIARQPLSAGGFQRLAYILGPAPISIFVGTDIKKWVVPAHLGLLGLNDRNFPGYQAFNKIASPEAVVKTNIGHSLVDAHPGDFSAVGKMVAMYVSDYMAGFTANGAEFWVDPLSRRLVEQSYYRSVYTINSVNDTATVDRSVITSKKRAGNVDDAFFRCLKETEKSIVPKELDADVDQKTLNGLNPVNLNSKNKPIYRDVEHSGDMLYGTHKGIIAEDGTTPLYREYTGMDGSHAILTTTRMRIGKTPYLKTPVYVGAQKASPRYTEIQPDPKDWENPLKKLEKADDSKLWNFLNNPDLFIEDGGYPEGFLDTGKFEYEVDPNEGVEIPDKLLKDEKFKVVKRQASIDFLDDGSIMLMDGWGSYILLSRGNIELHAVNNLFNVTGRDALTFAGANCTIYSDRDLSLQARTGDLMQLGGNNVRIQSGDRKNTGETIIESKNGIQLLSNKLRIDGLYIGITCHNPFNESDATAGAIKVIAERGDIRMLTRNFTVNSTATSITAGTAGNTVGFVLDTSVVLAGSVSVLGGLHCTRSTIDIPVMSADGSVTKQPTKPEVQADITTDYGHLRVNGSIYGAGLLWVASQIVASEVCTLEQQEKLKSIQEKEKVLSQTSSAKHSTPKLPNISVGNVKALTEALAPRSAKNFTFTFGSGSVACRYTLAAKQPTKKNNTDANTGYVDADNNPQYIYPGEAFWISNGLYNKLNNETVGFKNIPKASANNN